VDIYISVVIFLIILAVLLILSIYKEKERNPFK